MLPKEYGAHTHGMFWTGVVLTPLLLQGWIPSIATFLNTPAWTMPRKLLLPHLSLDGEVEEARAYLSPPGQAGGGLDFGMFPGALYMYFNPDSIAHPDRWSYGPWLQALKYTPYAHVFSFVFGVMLADWTRWCRARDTCGYPWGSPGLPASTAC